MRGGDASPAPDTLPQMSRKKVNINKTTYIVYHEPDTVLRACQAFSIDYLCKSSQPPRERGTVVNPICVKRANRALGKLSNFPKVIYLTSAENGIQPGI